MPGRVRGSLRVLAMTATAHAHGTSWLSVEFDRDKCSVRAKGPKESIADRRHCGRAMLPIRASIRASIRALVATTVFLQCCGAQRDGGFTLGRRQPGDELIEHREELARGSPDYALAYARTYVASNEHLVTQLDVADLGHGATAALVAGGPGHTFVSLSFAILRRGQMHFNVTLYGKLPPYRKVVP